MTRNLGAYLGVLVVGLAFGAWLLFQGFRSGEDVPSSARDVQAADLDGEVILDGLRLGTQRDKAGLLDSEAGVAPPSVSVDKVEESGSPDPNRDPVQTQSKPCRDPVAALIDQLYSDDVAERRAAAERIVSRGCFTIERVARHASSLDAVSWQTFAEAVIGKTWPPSPACALVSAAHTAPEAHRRRLIDLARRLSPEAGRTPTPQEIEALVRRELIEKRGLVDDDFYGEPVAIYGHAGMPATLRLLRESDPDIIDPRRASSLLSTIAQPEDIPVLRALLLQGNSIVVAALGRLGALGFPKALDVLVEAVRSGRFDLKIARALSWTSNRPLAARSVREWIAARGPGLPDEDRILVAWLFQELDSREDIPTLEAWSSSSRDPGTLHGLGRALMKLGSAKGIDMLVRIAEGKKAKPPFDRITAEGIDDARREVVIKWLGMLAAKVSTSENRSSRHGPWEGSGSRELDQVAAAVRAWWETSRDKIQFDERAGEWRLKSD